MHIEAVDSTGLFIWKACLIIMKLEENRRSVRSVCGVIAQRLKKLQNVPNLGIMGRMHEIAQIVLCIGIV